MSAEFERWGPKRYKTIIKHALVSPVVFMSKLGTDWTLGLFKRDRLLLHATVAFFGVETSSSGASLWKKNKRTKTKQTLHTREGRADWNHRNMSSGESEPLTSCHQRSFLATVVQMKPIVMKDTSVNSAAPSTAPLFTSAGRQKNCH